MTHIIQYLESVSGITWFCILAVMAIIGGEGSKHYNGADGRDRV
jgi:hypothetical protein